MHKSGNDEAAGLFQGAIHYDAASSTPSRRCYKCCSNLARSLSPPDFSIWSKI